MQKKTDGNSNLADRQFNSICKQIIEVLEGIGHFQRRFFPPEFPELRDDLLSLRRALKKTVDEIAHIHVPAETDRPWKVISEAGGLLLEALDLTLEASPQDMQDAVTRAMRSFRRVCRIQEKLYPIRQTSAAIDRFFQEPGASDCAAKPVQGQQSGQQTGLQHTGVEDSYYARGAMSLYVPEFYEETDTWPLIIALHGGFGHGRDFVWTWLREARSRGYILMAPSSIQTTWSLLDPDIDGAALISMLEHVKGRWNIDADQILLTGISDGATFALVSALQPDSPFSAFAPVAGILPPLDLTAAKNKRIYWVHGALDWMFPVQTARTAVEALKSADADVQLHVIEDLSHTYPREENGAILDWFESGRA